MKKFWHRALATLVVLTLIDAAAVGIYLRHPTFGSLPEGEQQLQIVVELKGVFEFPQRTAEDHLSTATLSTQVLNVLNIVQARVSAFVPLRYAAPSTVTLYSRHASDLAEGLLALVPVTKLTRTLRGDRLDDDMGMQADVSNGGGSRRAD